MVKWVRSDLDLEPVDPLYNLLQRAARGLDGLSVGAARRTAVAQHVARVVVDGLESGRCLEGVVLQHALHRLHESVCGWRDRESGQTTRSAYNQCKKKTN